MSKAPERIWMGDDGRIYDVRMRYPHVTEFVRADLYQQQNYRAKYAQQAERIAELEARLEEMTTDRDRWRNTALWIERPVTLLAGIEGRSTE